MLLMILLTSMMRRTLEMTMVHLNILHRVTQKACSSSIFKIIFTSTPENISQKKTREASVINSPLEQGWSKNKFGVKMMLKNHGTFLGRKEFVRSIKNDRRCM